MDSNYYIIGHEKGRFVDITSYKNQTAAFFDKMEPKNRSSSRAVQRRLSTDTESSDSGNDLKSL